MAKRTKEPGKDFEVVRKPPARSGRLGPVRSADELKGVLEVAAVGLPSSSPAAPAPAAEPEPEAPKAEPTFIAHMRRRRDAVGAAPAPSGESNTDRQQAPATAVPAAAAPAATVSAAVEVLSPAAVPAPGEPLGWSEDQYVREILGAWERAEAAYIEAGRLLRSFKQEHHRTWVQTAKTRLPFSVSTAQRLMRVAEAIDGGEVPPAVLERLPKSYAITYEYLTLEEHERKRALNEGVVHPAAKKEDLVAWKKKIRGPTAQQEIAAAAAAASILLPAPPDTLLPAPTRDGQTAYRLSEVADAIVASLRDHVTAGYAPRVIGPRTTAGSRADLLRDLLERAAHQRRQADYEIKRMHRIKALLDTREQMLRERLAELGDGDGGAIGPGEVLDEMAKLFAADIAEWHSVAQSHAYPPWYESRHQLTSSDESD